MILINRIDLDKIMEEYLKDRAKSRAIAVYTFKEITTQN